MREILFRGMTEKGKWVYGVPVYLNKEAYIVRDFCLGGSYTDDWVEEKTIGQYTGLTDKNGKKIFEGDIIQFGEDEEYDWEFNIGVVKFGEGTFDSGVYVYTGFFYEDRKGNIDHNTLYDWEEDWERCKVIGNIYDNPELLRGGE